MTVCGVTVWGVKVCGVTVTDCMTLLESMIAAVSQKGSAIVDIPHAADE